MTIQATAVGRAPRPPADRRRRCVRCGLQRSVNRGARDRLCKSCAEVTEELQEREVWT